MSELAVERMLGETKVLVCCGSGGVGKTTTAAAIGLLAAMRGRSVLVMTIDPAKRLAQALGLADLSHEPQRIDLAVLDHVTKGSVTKGRVTPSQTPFVTGSLNAMMLDTKHTFDALIEKYAPNADVKQTIFANSYYQHLSTSLMGSREFMAMEKVYEMTAANAFDLVIVDTPPSEHALDFLDAPRRLFELFEGSFVNLLLQPYRLAGRIGFDLFRRSSDRLLKVFEKLTGYELLADLSDFFLAFSGMFDGFKDRSRRVGEILRRADTRFLLVCAPEPTSLSQADRFFARLGAERLPVGGLIVNRVNRTFGSKALDRSDLTAEDQASIAAVTDENLEGRALIDRLLETHRELSMLASADAAAVAATDVAHSVPTARVPRFDRDLASLRDLADFAEALCAPLNSDRPTASDPSSRTLEA